MPPNIQPRDHPRRGALLLVVLSMLILFLMRHQKMIGHGDNYIVTKISN